MTERNLHRLAERLTSDTVAVSPVTDTRLSIRDTRRGTLANESYADIVESTPDSDVRADGGLSAVGSIQSGITRGRWTFASVTLPPWILCVNTR